MSTAFAAVPVAGRLGFLTPAGVGLLCCTAAMATLGASVPVTRDLLGYPPAAGQALRYGLAALVLAAIAWQARRDRPPIGRAEWLRLAAIAACGLAAYNFFLLGALRHAQPAAVATLLGSAPIVMAIAAPVLARRAPALRIVLAAVIVAVGTACLNGLGPLAPVGLLLAAGALAADIAFSLLAAPLIPRLGAVTVAAATCALSVPMFVATALVTGEVGRWRPPEPSESAAIVFLGLVLTAGAFVTWFHGLRHLGPAKAGLCMGAVPVAALAVTSVQSAVPPSGVQAVGVAAVFTGLVAAQRAAPLAAQLRVRTVRLGAHTSVVLLVAASLGCTRPVPATPLAAPDLPVRGYFTALETADYTTAYSLSRSAKQWLENGGLASGYQPPTGHQIMRVDFASAAPGSLAYVRVRYQLAGDWAESSVEVQRSGAANTWAITSGSTGRLDVISPHCPRLRIANVLVEAMLTAPRVSGGQPGAGFFDVPPGVYTVSGTSGCKSTPVEAAVPAAWRGGQPVTVTMPVAAAAGAPGLLRRGECLASSACRLAHGASPVVI